MNPSTTTQNRLSLIGRALIAMLFIPAGYAKIAGFASVTGYIASKRVPLPQVAAAIAIVGGLLALVAWGAGGWSVDRRAKR